MPNTANFALQLFARVSSAVVFVLIGMFLFGGNESQGFNDNNEIVGFALFPVTLLLGMLISWVWEIPGAVVSMLGLGGFYLWHFATSGSLPEGPWFLIFSVPAFLFLASGILNRR